MSSSEEKNHWVHDYETLSNCFVACFEHYKTNVNYTFTIHEKLNQFDGFVKFLKQNIANREWHISFNGLGFDGQITEFILRNENLLRTLTAEQIAKRIYQKAQDVINRQSLRAFQEFSERDMKIRQVDVFKLNHWDNPAKMSGLKWIQFSLDWENIQEMPISHTTEVQSFQEIFTIINYCKNDVRSTKRIMQWCSKQINLRQNLTNTYNINLYSASEPRISKELFLYFLEERTDIPKYELKKMRTFRKEIVVKDILLPYIQFQTPEFQLFHQAYKKLIIDPKKIKGAFKHTLVHKGVETEYGLGGMHGATKAGVYEAKDGMIIMTSDVTSYYPNLAIRNKWAPAHLPKQAFCEQYEWFFDERKKIPKSDPRNYVYKIILNSTYGLSIEPNSFLYDPQLGMQITINGQMLLSMLYEMLSLEIPGSIPLMQNTDGLEMMIPVEHKDKYLDICKRWEKMTMLELEHDQYKKMIIRDVNNYIAIAIDRKAKTKSDWDNLPESYSKWEATDGYWYNPIKCKGAFEFEELPLHKNKSYLAVRKAVYNYFIHGKSPEESLRENKNIFDFCAGAKIKGNWRYEMRYKVYGKSANGIEIPVGERSEELQDTLRYYISNNGGKIIKVNRVDLREIQQEAMEKNTGQDWLQTVYNVATPKKWEEFDINYEYYLFYAYKEIHNIIPPPEKQDNNQQLQLEF